MSNDTPFEIRLMGEKGPALRAVLINHSDVPQVILHDPKLQPSRLDLNGPDGEPVDAFDSRRVKKFDNTIRCEQLRTIPAPGEIEFGAVRFRRGGQGYAVTWGPFEFEDLPAGAYTARIVWESTADSCLDESTQEQRKLRLWLGEVRSNEVTLRLP
jgi:hypothetical protein